MEGSRSLRSARLLVGVMAGVVVSFLLATGISQYLERSIAHGVEELVDNAMPSVELLTMARGHVHRMGDAVDRYLQVPRGQRADAQQVIAETWTSTHSALALYRALPMFKGEPALNAPLSEALAELAPQVQRIAHDQDVDLGTMHRLFDQIDQTLGHIATYDAQQGQRIGRSIGSVRAESKGVILLLDALSVVLAIVAVTLAIRQLRQAIRSIEGERDTVERRADELAARTDELGMFAGRVAHDILNPLGTAAMSLEVVREASDDPELIRKTAERGLAALQRGRRLVDGLLAFARAGGAPDAAAHAQVAPTIAGVVDEMSQEAKREQIELVLHPIAPGTIACSEGVLISLLSNLLRNAIRYMGESLDRRIEVRAAIAGATWRVEVRDTGPGIPPGQEQRIFEPYIQLAHGTGGIGLGLATVKRLVIAHGGAVGVTAQVPGCTFWFELPGGARASRPSPAPPDDDGKAVRLATATLVESEPTGRDRG